VPVRSVFEQACDIMNDNLASLVVALGKETGGDGEDDGEGGGIIEPEIGGYGGGMGNGHNDDYGGGYGGGGYDGYGGGGGGGGGWGAPQGGAPGWAGGGTGMSPLRR